MAHTKKWEEAESEFFQESYPSVDRGSTTSDLTAFLPQRTKKNHYSIVGVGTFSTTKSSSRTARIRAAIQGLDADDSDDDLEVLDFTDENLSTEDEVWNEIQKIRDMPISLSRKKALKSQYQKCPKIKMSRPQKLSFSLRRIASSFQKLIQRLKYGINGICGPPYNIQKSCGLDISMTFLVLKHSIALNLLYALVIGVFILLPYFLWSSPPSQDWLIASNSFPIFNNNYNSSSVFKNILDIAQINLIGLKATLINSMLFYGYYDVNSMTLSQGFYSLPIAYIMIVLGVIAFLSFGLMLKLAVIIKTLSYERGSDIWFKNIFGYWNYSITSMIMVNDKQESLYKHLKFKLNKDRRYDMRCPCLGKFCLCLTRMIIFLLTLAIIFGVGKSIHYIETTFSDATEDKSFPFSALYLTFIYRFMPIVLNILKRMEKYSLNMESNIYITRLLIIRLVGLYFYLSPIFERRSVYPCYENEIGLKLALIYVFELLLKIFSTFFLHLPRVLLSKYCCYHKSRISYRPYKAEFNIQASISENVFDLTLCTLGILYCPYLPLISVVKSLCMYLVNLFHALVNCDCSSKVYSPSYTLMKFTFYFFITTISSMLSIGYVFTFISPSKTCGPFPHQDAPLFNFVVECFSNLPFYLKNTLKFIVRADVLSVAIMMLLLMNYIFYIKFKSHERMACNLKSQLVLQGQDKKYLTSRINHLIAKARSKETNGKK